MLKTQVFKNLFRAMRFNVPSTLRMTFLDTSRISYYQFQTALCELASTFKTQAVKTLVLTAFQFNTEHIVKVVKPYPCAGLLHSIFNK